VRHGKEANKEDSPKIGRIPTWREFVRIRNEAIRQDPEAFEQFLADRKDDPPEDREYFADWRER